MNHSGISAVGILIFVTLIIVFILFPIAQFAIEKLVIIYILDNISDAIDSSLYSVGAEINVDHLSDRDIKIFREDFQNRFNFILKKNLLKMMESTDKTKRLISNINLKDITFYDENDSSTKIIKCKIIFTYQPTLYRSVYEGDSGCEIMFNRNIEIPTNN